MTFLFDADTLIRSARQDLTFAQFSNFWNWLEQLAHKRIVQIPECICNELLRSEDPLSSWIRAKKPCLQRSDTLALEHWKTVIAAYGTISESDLERIQNDSMLIAHALSLQGNGVVVSYENHKNATAIKNMKIPTICGKLRVPCIQLPSFLWQMLNPF